MVQRTLLERLLVALSMCLALLAIIIMLKIQSNPIQGVVGKALTIWFYALWPLAIPIVCFRRKDMAVGSFLILLFPLAREAGTMGVDGYARIIGFVLYLVLLTVMFCLSFYMKRFRSSAFLCAGSILCIVFVLTNLHFELMKYAEKQATTSTATYCRTHPNECDPNPRHPTIFCGGSGVHTRGPFGIIFCSE